MRKLRWLGLVVQKMTAAVSEPVRRLVGDWVRGSVVARSVVLCAVARALRPDKSGFEAALERLSRGLGKKNRPAIEQVHQNYLRQVRRWTVEPFDVVAIDLSDIIKPYGRKMPYLSVVRDGSKSTKEHVVLGKGWQTVEIDAVDERHRVLPLHRHVFSTEHPEFKSETVEVGRALDRVLPFVDPSVWAVLDRGFDGHKEFEQLDKRFQNWCVRQRGDRQVYLPGHDEPMRMQTLAQQLPKRETAYPRHVHKGKLVKSLVQFGYCTIEVPLKASRSSRRKPACKLRTLIAVVGRPGQPLMVLLVSRPVRSAAEARRWIEAYRRRWSCEEQTRLGKQSAEFEDLRVLRWAAIANLLVLTVVTEGVLALLQVLSPRRAKRLALLAPIVDDVPPFAIYRIWMTVAMMLSGRLPATR